MQNKNTNYSSANFMLAMAMCLTIIFGWQHFYEKPRLEKVKAQQKRAQTVKAKSRPAISKVLSFVKREVAKQDFDRVSINTDNVSGSIALKGARFDDLLLKHFNKTVSADSGNVELLSPAKTEDAYFAEFGWYSANPNTELPNANTVWNSDRKSLSPGEVLNLTWSNEDNILFTLQIALDNEYMFSIKQIVKNLGSKIIAIQPYGLINRNHLGKEKAVNILHQGPIASIDGRLEEVSYDTIKDDKSKKFTDADVNWVGITDKYWLTAFIPDGALRYNANFNYASSKTDKYQVDFISKTKIISPKESLELDHKLFTGPKEVKMLDAYSDKYEIPLFDRSIDFGWFYILTKPLFYALSFFYGIVGNFGIAIMALTVIVKLAMFGMANKSFRSMKKMKALQPKIERMKELYGDDKVKFNQEIMELYKREKVNPVSGCLPMLIQIPVFFSLYKVLYVSIEMRHAPFFGWIQDLSAPDPVTIVNLFGLLPFTPPEFLAIGIWPMLMAITMFLQQRLSPAPSDPAQAQVMKFLPLIFLFMFSRFAAGLVIYWTWSNLLSIAQQYWVARSRD